MRVSREKAAQHRDDIVAAASRLFREQGFDGVGLDAIMEAAGLTHGGFYRNFASKEDLAAAAVAHGLNVAAEWQATMPSLAAYAAAYLSPRHRDGRGAGCVMAALGSDIARHSAAAKQTFTAHLRQQIDRFTRWLGGRDAAAAGRARAIATVAGLVGALVLARAVDDVELSDEILAAGRAVFGGSTPADGETKLG